MTNFEGILNMDLHDMEAFLDQVYLTGLNTGMFAATLPGDSEEQNQLLDHNPFDQAWLSQDAEEAVIYKRAADGDEYLLDALTTAVLRAAGIDQAEHTPEDAE